jgi:N-carbamoylputrescine amidase
MITLTASAAAPLSRSTESRRPPLRVGLVQHRWRSDRADLAAVLRSGIDRAAAEGARVVFLPEITLLRYPADVPAGQNPGAGAEDLMGGPTFALAATAAVDNGIFVHASLYERAPGADGLFPFLLTRRPDTYAALTDPVDSGLPYGVGHEATAVVR